MGTIQDAFTSTDPKMVELRAQMFQQVGVLPRQGEAVVQGQMVMHTSIKHKFLLIFQHLLF